MSKWRTLTHNRITHEIINDVLIKADKIIIVIRKEEVYIRVHTSLHIKIINLQWQKPLNIEQCFTSRLYCTIWWKITIFTKKKIASNENRLMFIFNGTEIFILKKKNKANQFFISFSPYVYKAHYGCNSFAGGVWWLYRISLNFFFLLWKLIMTHTFQTFT